MKTWREHSTNIDKYYEWIHSENKPILKMINIISFNATNIRINTDEFYQYCINELLNILIRPEKYYFYIILNEKLTDVNSKVEHYKKCWKKISSEFDLSKFELGQEIGYEYEGEYFYSGIAKTSINNFYELMGIANVKSNRCVIFASKVNYFTNGNMDCQFIRAYIEYNKYGNIDYTKCFEQCCIKHDIGIRFGKSSNEAELTLSYNYLDKGDIFAKSVENVIEEDSKGVLE